MAISAKSVHLFKYCIYKINKLIKTQIEALKIQK